MKFMKLQGAGNDFILIEESQIPSSLQESAFSRLVRHICDPHFCLGADGLMRIGPPVCGGHFSMRFYNRDGSAGELCGNGARCLVCYGLHRGLCSTDGTVRIETDSGMIWGQAAVLANEDPGMAWGQAAVPAVEDPGCFVPSFPSEAGIGTGLFTVRMPDPSCFRQMDLEAPAFYTGCDKPLAFNRSKADLEPPAFCTGCDRESGVRSYACFYMELGDPGVPHLILPLPDWCRQQAAPTWSPETHIRTLAPLLRPLAGRLRAHPALPKGANVNFYQITGSGTLTLYTYERGVEDFTLACGSGACCTASALLADGLLSPGPVLVHTAGGTLQVSCDLFCPLPQEKNALPIHNVHLTGPAEIVAEGILFLHWDSGIFPLETALCP